MTVSLIVAVADNGVIGRAGGLPWHQAADLKRFKRITMGHHLVMGRRTWDSVGVALPGRTCIVLSRSPDLELPGGVLRAASLDEALALAAGDDEVFVAGGAEVYRQALERCDRLHITRVHARPEGDTRLVLDLADWRLVSAEEHPADGRNDHRVTFEVWEREPPPVRPVKSEE